MGCTFYYFSLHCQTVSILYTVSIYNDCHSVSLSSEVQCTERFMELSLVRYRAQRIDSGSMPADDETYVSEDTLTILQEYQFNCSSTNISSLILGINIRRADSQKIVFPSVQIFRPSNGNVNQYDLVTGSERTIYYSTSNVSTSGEYEYPLNPPIPVMSGDLLAVSQPKPMSTSSGPGNIDRIYYIDGISFLSSQDIPIGSTTVDLNNSTIITDELILVYPVTGKTHIHCIIELLYYH